MKKQLLGWMLLLAVLLTSAGGCSGRTGLPAVPTGTAGSTGIGGEPDGSQTAGPTGGTDEPGTPPTPTPEVPVLAAHWTLDSMGADGALTDELGAIPAQAQACETAEGTVSGSGLLLMPTRGSGISFGTGITDLLKEKGAITLAFWMYKSMRGQTPRIFNLYMEDGEAGLSVELDDNTVYLTVRSDVDDIIHTKIYKCSGVWEWNHLAISVDIAGGHVKLYWNGSEQSPTLGDSSVVFHRSTYQPGIPAYADRLGGCSVSHFDEATFSGYLDEVYLYSGVLESTQIRALYQSGAGAVTAMGTEQGMYNTLRTLTSGANAVLSVNSPLVLHQAQRCWLEPGNAQARLIEQDGGYFLPASFFADYFGRALTASELDALPQLEQNGECWVSLLPAAERLDIACSVREQGLILLGENCGAYSDAVVEFLQDYFSGAARSLPLPEEDFAASRGVVKHSDYNSNGISLGSPSIAQLPDGTLIASFDYNGTYTPVNGGTSDTEICRSVNGGADWERIALVPRLMWATLFELNGSLYLAGRDTKTGKLAIVRSTDGGESWTSADQGQIDSDVGSLHHAPTPALICNGRVYIAFEDSCDAEGKAEWTYTKRAYMMSAPVDADLLAAGSWTKSNYVAFDPSWMDPSLYYGTQMGFLEGNAVAGKDGTVLIILRVESDPTDGLACVLRLSADNKTLTFDRIIHLPVGKDKFVIRYDAETGCYIAIGNVKTTENCPLQRNVVAMYVSNDLVDWHYAVTLLADPSLMPPEQSMRCHGLQYPDFIIAGDDLYLVTREAVGETTYYHNANEIASYVIRDFRCWIPGTLP